MKFTTPCFVRVEDAEKRDELLDWLQDIGYDLYQSARSLNYPILCCNMIDDEPGNVYGEYAEELTGLCGIFAYDCGENIELFKALAAMNDENDLNQWFIAHVVIRFDRLKDMVQTETGERFIMAGDWFKVLIPRANNIRAKWMAARCPNQLSHKATKEEIIEHFKEK